MPVNPPRTLQTLQTGDSTTSRALQAVKSAVDPLLGLVNTTFQVGNDGALGFLRRIKTFAASTIAATTANITTISGTTAQYTQGNFTNVQATNNVNASNTVAGNYVNGNSVYSANGFRTIIDMGTCWISSATASTRYRTRLFAQNYEATNTYNAYVVWQADRSGSIVGIQGFSSGTAGGTAYVEVFKNYGANPTSQPPASGSPIIDTALGSATQYTPSYLVYSKGTYPFVAGDYYTMSCAFTAAGNQFMHMRLIVELGA